MIGIGDVILIGDAGNHAEAVLQTLGKLVGGGLQGSAVEGEVDVVFSLPALAGIVHVLHDLQGKGLGLRVGVRAAGHVLDALIKTGVAQADGGVTAVEQLVNGLALLEPGQSAVLPQNGGSVREGTLQAVVAAHKSLMAQLQPLVKNLPELLLVLAGGQGHIHQIDGDHTLIEPAVILGLAVFIHIGGQEGAAAHAGVAVAFAVLVNLQLQHLLLADVVRHHPLGGALGSQPGQIPVGGVLGDVVLLQHIDELGEGGGDPHALFILHALVPLAEHLLNDESQILLLLGIPGFVEIHEHGDERGLTVGGHEGNHLVLDGLYAPAYLVPEPILYQLGDGSFLRLNTQGFQLLFHYLADFLPADLDKGSQVGKANGLTAVLVGSHLGDNLGGDVAGGGEGMGLFNEGTGDDGAVLQHILQVYQIAVVHMLGIVVCIMEVDDTGLVSVHNLPGQENPAGNVLGNLTGHVVPLHGVDGGILVGVFLLHFLVVALNEAENPVVGGVGLTE